MKRKRKLTAHQISGPETKVGQVISGSEEMSASYFRHALSSREPRRLSLQGNTCRGRLDCVGIKYIWLNQAFNVAQRVERRGKCSEAFSIGGANRTVGMRCQTHYRTLTAAAQPHPAFGQKSHPK